MDPNVHPYATLAYARSLAHVGRPLNVPEWNCHVIVRDWKGLAQDAIGPYPIACIAHDANLKSGLSRLREAGLVTVTAVIDGLVGPALPDFQREFSHFGPYKTHYIVDQTEQSYQPTKHHRDEIRRASHKGVEVAVVRLDEILDDWNALYGSLVSRHGVDETQRFPRESFVALSECPGVVVIAAYIGSELISAHLWIQYGNTVWSHLAASSERGYATSATYAVYDQSIRYFGGRIISLGGVAGRRDSTADGLARFKSGFANRIQASYLIGAVLDKAAYVRLSEGQTEQLKESFFPSYRSPSAPSTAEPRP